MNILITGSNGFLGQNLKKLKNYGYNIFELNISNCNLLDQEEVTSFFDNNKTQYDLVLHTAVEGGRRNKKDEDSIVYNNLLMLYNLLANQNYYQCIISFGSGAELDRRYHINPLAKNRYPIDPYGLSKSLIDKLGATEEKLCNFRIYNCFGDHEQPDRMIRSSINKYINKEKIVIHQNRKVDFFYVDDLVLLIHFFIDSNQIPKIFDCCYKEKPTLLDIATIINNLDDHKIEIVCEDSADSINCSAKDYYGHFVDTKISYIGLENGIREMYQKYLS